MWIFYALFKYSIRMASLNGTMMRLQIEISLHFKLLKFNEIRQMQLLNRNIFTVLYCFFSFPQRDTLLETMLYFLKGASSRTHASGFSGQSRERTHNDRSDTRTTPVARMETFQSSFFSVRGSFTKYKNDGLFRNGKTLEHRLGNCRSLNHHLRCRCVNF